MPGPGGPVCHINSVSESGVESGELRVFLDGARHEGAVSVDFFNRLPALISCFP